MVGRLCSRFPPTSFQGHSPNVTALLVLVILSIFASPPTTEAFELNLPGGRSISYSPSSGVLRIDVAGDSSRKDGETTLPSAPPMSAQPSKRVLDSIDVRDTGTSRGCGAYSTAPLPGATFLGWYEGETVRGGREELDEWIAAREREIGANERRSGSDGGGEGSDRYRRGAMDYVLSLDGGMTFIDGYDRATSDRDAFTPAHLNHVDGNLEGCNCARVLNGEATAVAFFTKRDVQAGEELRFDYGRSFWEDRKKEKL